LNAGEVRAFLVAHGLAARRDLGQNFLHDERMAEKLARIATVGPGDRVIEIGTGLGTLTRALAARAAQVITVEVDAGIVRALRSEAVLPANVELIHGDALELDLDTRSRLLSSDDCSTSAIDSRAGPSWCRGRWRGGWWQHREVGNTALSAFFTSCS
jgi:phospholipid N-methyltransferase